MPDKVKKKDIFRLVKREKELIVKLSNIGMKKKKIAEMFNILESSVFSIISKEKKKNPSMFVKSYSVQELAEIMTEYLLQSMINNLPDMTTEQKLKFLPDLIRVKDFNTSFEGSIAELYIPDKVKIQKGISSSLKELENAEEPPPEEVEIIL